ncbi:pectate lyase-like adhesive domain-containing protein, partial [Ligilactobacillus apodemi]|uniref:pectate lyase-like adhesive domain-containing protein n=2 Tax=Ligilactobacillus apodemi TaxID=307126 RepID=UPI00138EDCFF
MLSRNNTKFHLQRMEPQKQHFTIKKFSVGVASVLVSCTFAAYSNANLTARADENATTDETAEVISNTANDSNVVTLSGSSAGANSETPASSTPSSAPASAGTQSTENTTTTKTAAPAASSTANTQAQTATTVEPSSETNENSSSAGTQASEAATSEATTNFENATSEANNNINNAENTTSLATASANEAATSQASSTTAPTSTPSNEALTTNSVAPADETTQSFGESALTALAADTPVAVAETTNETTVSSWADLVSAMANSNYNIINVNGALTATSNNSIGSNGHTVTVKGADGASINFGNYSLTATGGSWNVTFDNLTVTTGVGTGVIDLNATTGTNTVTFKDVTATGTSLYGGGGTTNVIIDGTTTSTVDNASTGKANTYSATSREANIHSANSVTIADGATFTLNRSSIGDGINLPDGSTVKVGDNATFTVNMNTNNATDSARYHNAGIFMEQGGSFITGRDSVVTMNTSIGQAVSIGVKRPADSYTDTDRWGGYTENPTRYDGPTVVTFGENSTFNFTGRDGFMLGDNATFTSGEYSTVHFQNKGRGVALDLGDDSNIIISKHSNTLFESDGKGPNSSTATPSGGYSAYNYIGVDENSNILIDEYATFRVILTNRGDNDWDDVISLNSQKTASVVSFTSKQGAVVDIRDDNTNFYAELISFPLGTP